MATDDKKQPTNINENFTPITGPRNFIPPVEIEQQGNHKPATQQTPGRDDPPPSPDKK